MTATDPALPADRLQEIRDERDHWIGEAKRYERLYRSKSGDSVRWWKAKKAAEAERDALAATVARVERLARHGCGATSAELWAALKDGDGDA